MRAKKFCPLRRIGAWVLAFLMILNIIPGNVLVAQAATDETEYTAVVSFPMSGKYGKADKDSVAVTVKDENDAKVNLESQEKKENEVIVSFKFTDTATYSYAISSPKYVKDITGTFEVKEPEDGTETQVSVEDVKAFDAVEGQFTTVKLTGTVTGKGDAPVEGATVKATVNDKDQSAVTDAHGTYSFDDVDISSTVTLEVSAENYDTKTETVPVEKKDVEKNIALSKTQYAVTVSGYDREINDLYIDGEEITTEESVSKLADSGSDVEIKVFDKDNNKDRYTLKYAVDGNVNDATEVNFDDKNEAVIKIPVTKATTIAFSYETKLAIENIAYEPEIGEWNSKAIKISGKVTGADDNFEVQLVKAGEEGAVVTSADKNFGLECAAPDTSTAKETYKIKLVDKKTNLSVLYPEDKDIDVQWDTVKPVINEVTHENVSTDWYEDANSVWWAKDGAQYTVSATDEGSGLDEDCFTVSGGTKGDTTLDKTEDGKAQATVTVTVKGDENTEIKDKVTVKDKAGNDVEESTIVPYKIDNSAPKITDSDMSKATGLKKVTRNSKEVYYWDKSEIVIPIIEPTDAGSGVKEYSYRVVKEGMTDAIVKDTNSSKVTIDEKDNWDDGTYEVQVKAIDNLDNESEYETVATFIVDKTAPEITYEFEKQNLLDRIKTLLGIYHSQNIVVHVTATDAGGIGFEEADNIFETLEYNDKEIKPDTDSVEIDSKDPTIAKATYTLELDNEKVIFAPIKTNAQDALGNKQSEKVIAKGKNSNLDEISGDIKIMLESNKPEVEAGSTDADGEKHQQLEVTGGTGIYPLVEGKAWYSAGSELTYNYTIKDADSGIYSIKYKINGKEHVVNVESGKSYEDAAKKCTVTGNGKLGENGFTTTDDQRMTEASVAIKLDDSDRDTATGKCTLELFVEDNAGNESNPVSQTIYFDVDAPVVNSFKFAPADVNEKDGETATTALTTDYGYFFTRNTKVTVNVTDYIKGTETDGSGVKEVQFKLVAASTREELSVAWTTIGNDNIKGHDYSFEVSEGFKGRIYVRAKDNVDQSTVGYAAGENGIQPKGVILEGQGTHTKHTSLGVQLSGTPYKDAKGQPLYAGAATASVTAGNDFAGIKEAVYSRTDRENAAFNGDLDAANGIGASGGFTWTSENNIVTNLSLTDVINYGVDKEVSDITLDFNTVCNANHSDAVARQTISYDTQAPRLQITWDNNDVKNEKYYKANRTATIVVTERNFDESKCEFITTGNRPAISGWSHNGDVHTATVSYTEDGDYTFSFRVTDRAGHTTDYGKTDEFTIDKTAPVISVSYNNNDAKNGFYYKEARTATVTITEHNFRASEVSASMTASNNGSGIAAPSVNGWSSSGDNNVATIAYNYDGDFTFGMTYEDLAGNPAVPYGEDHFVVDLTDPQVDIYDIIDKSANNDVVAPGVTYSDTNYSEEGVTITLKGANNGDYKLDGNKSSIANGYNLKLNDFPREKEVDDLYTMTAHVEDLSGRVAEKQVMFSVNRFGSVYVLDTDTEKLVKNNDGYTNKEQKVGIREINVDLLEAKDVSVSRDGDTSKLKENTDYTVKASGDDTSWKEYYYQLDKKNFEEEGSYNVTIFSKDRAENTQDNKNNKRNAECNVEFVIDKTAPSTVVSGIENGGRYKETEKTVQVNAKDNILLDKIVAEVDGETVKEFDAAEIAQNDGAVDFVLDSANTWQNIKVYSVDKAGNTDESQISNMRVIVTSNVWVQFIHNTVALVITILIILAIAAAAIWFFVIGKRKKEQE